MFSIQQNMYIFLRVSIITTTTTVASKMDVFKHLPYASEYLKCDQSVNECD